MLSGLIPSVSRHEKEVTILDIIKSAEKEKKQLDICIKGEYEPWVSEWAKKRGHSLGAGKDLAIIIDQHLDSAALASLRKKSNRVAVIYPSKELRHLPDILTKKIPKGLALEKGQEKDAIVKDCFYGLWNVAYFGFKDPRQDRYEVSAVFCLLALLLFLATAPDPVDDLLRHMKVHEYAYDYAGMYANAWGFSFNPYLLFDHFAGMIDQGFGEAGLKIMQGLAFLAFAAAFFLHTKGWSERFRIFMFVLILILVGTRITYARPAVFESFFFIIALLLSGPLAVLWGIFMGSFYYLFPIFLIPLVLVRREYLISLVASLAMWYAYAGPAYFIDIYHFIVSILTERVSFILENQSVLALLFNPFFLLLLYLFIKNRNFRYWLPLGFFVLFNQVRFIEVIALMMAVSLDEKKLGLDKIRFGLLEKAFFMGIMISLVPIAYTEYSIEEIPLQGKVVLCDSMECAFNVVYYGENISVSPSMEIALTEREIQIEMENMRQNGMLDCGIFEKYHYDILVENSLTEVPDCLELVDVERGYRIWRIVK